MFLTTLVTLAVVASVIDLLAASPSKLVACFSLSRNASQLFKVDANRSNTVDTMKLCFSLFFVSMHAVSGTDTPYGPIIISE